MSKSEKTAYELLPDLPDIFIRMMKPFEKLREEYGKIPMKEILKKYEKEYESQFGEEGQFLKEILIK